MFNMRDLYPQVGVLSTTEKTIPEGEEKKFYTSYPEEQTTDPVTEATGGNLLLSLAALVGLLVLMSI